MNVKVKLFASLRSFGPDEQVLALPDDATIDDVVRLLRIPATIRLLRIVNGEHWPAGQVLRDGDDLALFPPIAGGQAGPSRPFRTGSHPQKHAACSQPRAVS